MTAGYSGHQATKSERKLHKAQLDYREAKATHEQALQQRRQAFREYPEHFQACCDRVTKTRSMLETAQGRMRCAIDQVEFERAEASGELTRQHLEETNRE